MYITYDKLIIYYWLTLLLLKQLLQYKYRFNLSFLHGSVIDIKS